MSKKIPLLDLERLQSKKRDVLLDDFKARVINEEPYIVKIKNLISDREIEEILKLAKGRFERSNIAVDGELVYSTTRNSSTAYIFRDGMPDRENKYIERFVDRITYLTGCKRNQLEVMCVRYKKGQKFDEHVDYFDDNELGAFDVAGQRIFTFFIYLNTLEKEDGGTTEFTKLGLISKPIKGDSLFWINKDVKTGEMKSMTEHKGNPVLKEGVVKYGLNLWIRSSGFY